jgi:Flp pilus assembly protein TadG
MISSLKRLWRDRRGNSLAIAGAALPLVLGSAGLASDTIQWTLWKRQLQRAADSGAMAGVYAKASGNAVGTCTNISGSTYANPVAYDIKQNLKLKITPNCTLTNPPSSGTYASDANAVRVALEVQRRLSFSGLFMSTAPTIRATALATIVPSGTYCVVSLETAAVTGINATGSTDVNLGCGMITNSTSMSAAVATGSSEVTASPIAAVGGIPASTHWGTGTVLQPFTLAQEDPFKDVPNPTPSSCSNFPNMQNSDTWDWSASAGHQSGDVVCFKSEMDVKGDLTLGAATYILDAADIKMTTTSARLACNGCTIILTSSTAATNPASIGKPNINGGELDMVAPTSGPYKGIMIYQDRRATADNSIKINGNNDSFLEGAFYFPRAEFEFQGNAGMNSNCLQIVSKRVVFTGNSSVNNTCPTGSGASAFSGRRIRLVE